MKDGELRAEYLLQSYPLLAFEATGSLITKLWNPHHLDQVLYLDPQAGTARVLWSHCAQAWSEGQAEDFSSWDDASEPWPVAWASWRNEWLRCLSQGQGGHPRPGKNWKSPVVQLLCKASSQWTDGMHRLFPHSKDRHD